MVLVTNRGDLEVTIHAHRWNLFASINRTPAPARWNRIDPARREAEAVGVRLVFERPIACRRIAGTARESTPKEAAMRIRQVCSGTVTLPSATITFTIPLNRRRRSAGSEGRVQRCHGLL